MAFRRLAAARTRQLCQATWPVNESAGRRPADWKGWPDGKQFAVVLTHDVEGPDGLAKCRQVAELEMSLGFRSSFNFIPEGQYSVPPELRAWLIENGFEVGVHDLEHDGKLYRSRAGFQKKAARINRYIKQWGARGFRSGFMLRNLDWLHELDLLYDSSTFDTDPFEFQPDGAGTIFPFWIPLPPGGRARTGEASAQGYIELPYTLPQDSTLFLVLREQSPAIWIRKLDWIAAHGGMALVNVHPDYLRLEGERPRPHTFPAGFYAQFLQHLRASHAGKYINLLPRQTAQWAKTGSLSDATAASIAATSEVPSAIASKLSGKRAAVLLYSDYPADPRPRRAATAMIDAGMQVDLLCLSESDDEPLEECVNGVNVTRVRLKRRRDGVGGYIWLYSRFILSSFLFLTRRSFRRRYDVVHVHNMPDILVFGALIPKFLGARILLDLHDPMPELMTTIFGANPDSFKIRLLKRLEKLSLGFANAVITVNEACRKIFSSRSCPPAKITVVMNSPDETIFRERPAQVATSQPGKVSRYILMYHGSLVERHGLDLAVAAVDRLRASIPEIELRVYGQRTPYLDKVMLNVTTAGLGNHVSYLGPRNLEQIARAIGECSIGVIPNRRSVFTELNTPTRIFEYLSQSKPVIAPRAAGILDYFGPDDLVYFELGDVEDLTAKILYAYQHPDVVDQTLQRGMEIYRNHCWAQERRRFLQLVANVLAPSPASSQVVATNAERSVG